MSFHYKANYNGDYDDKGIPILNYHGNIGLQYNPIAISVKDMEGINLLLNILRHSELSVLCGPSGVGKSSLLNYLLPDQSISIGDKTVN